MPPGQAEAAKAAGPCSEANPILVGSKASPKPILMPSEVSSPPGWGGAGQWHSVAARSKGTDIVFQESLLGCPAQRPEQTEQTLCSVGKPVSRETASEGELCPRAGLKQQRLWLELEMTGFAERLVQGHRGCVQAGAVSTHRLRFSPAGPGRHNPAGVSQDSSGWVCPLDGLELLFGML